MKVAVHLTIASGGAYGPGVTVETSGDVETDDPRWAGRLADLIGERAREGTRLLLADVVDDLRGPQPAFVPLADVTPCLARADGMPRH